MFPPSTNPHHRDALPPGTVVGDTVVGAGLVGAGLWFVYLALATPLVSALDAAVRPSPEPGQPVLAWAAALGAPLVLVLLGADRLARIAAAIRTGRWRRPRSAFRDLPREVTIARDVVLDDGRPAPTLLVGPFGIAVVAEADGWSAGAPDDPRDAVARDAERVRRWLSRHDIDFVVRIYAAVITPDATLARSTTCAVVGADRLSAWLGSLQHQRSLSPDRRTRILRAMGAVAEAW